MTIASPGGEENPRQSIHEMILRLGRMRFGLPLHVEETAIREIVNSERLERIAEALLTVNNWQELLEVE